MSEKRARESEATCTVCLESLKSTGFTVAVGLDFTQAQIREAIRAHIETLTKTKAVGLFYFAGHGAQLAWLICASKSRSPSSPASRRSSA